MGVEYEHILLYKQRNLYPSSNELADLISGLIAGKFLPDAASSGWQTKVRWLNEKGWQTSYQYPLDRKAPPTVDEMIYPPSSEWLRRLEGSTFVMSWCCNLDSWTTLGLKHPIEPAYASEGKLKQARNDIVIMCGVNFFDLAVNELIGTSSAVCACGDSLIFSGQLKQSVRAKCQRCGAAYNPSEADSWISLHEFDRSHVKTKDPFPGGGLCRFAVVVNVGKILPDCRPTFSPNFMAICRKSLGKELVECGELA